MAAPVSDVWDFKRDGDHLWRWKRESLYHELIDSSQSAFPTFEACVADAQRRGYDGTCLSGTPPPDLPGRVRRKGR